MRGLESHIETFLSYLRSTLDMGILDIMQISCYGDGNLNVAEGKTSVMPIHSCIILSHHTAVRFPL